MIKKTTLFFKGFCGRIQNEVKYMENKHIEAIAEQLKVKPVQVANTLKLLEEGNTVPFIARYRKEMTQGLDEEQILIVQQEYQYQVNLAKRKEDVLRLIETQGKLTEEIKQAVEACSKLSQVEDIYRPYMQKKKTRATEAIAKGLEPLCDYLESCPRYGDVKQEAEKYCNDQITTVDEALQGAKDILAERVSDKAKLRWKIKESIEKYGSIVTKEKKKHDDEKKVYKMYYDHEEKLAWLAPHRIMAIDRAEKEKVISVSLKYDQDYLYRYAVRGITHDRETIAQTEIEEAVKDGLKRLAFPSVEREVRNELFEKASAQSIEVFSMNVERLLMQPPLNGKMILGVDPAFRTGCKLAVIDTTGKMLMIDAIYPHPPVNKKQEAKKKFLEILKRYSIEIIAIGNGTASRETESFVAEVIKENHLDIKYTLVSEAGASVYSASDLARAEFPDLQVEQRSAVSIARRLLDPLSELIKIDPKSIGVGQYQHDLPAKALNERLDFAILKSVNRVGVDLNTASVELLSHVSGLNKTIASNLVAYRNENGRFTQRKEIMKVSKLGAKAFEQSAGFLRIHQGDDPLEETGIHPESYGQARKIMEALKLTELGSEETQKKIEAADKEKLMSEIEIDQYTLEDILSALAQPLRDYRDQYDAPLLRSDILTLEDLKVGERLEGVVRNVVDFGAFVDIGLKEDGLIHVSKLSKEKISHPSEIVSIGDILEVSVYRIDEERKKVQLSLID